MCVKKKFIALIMVISMVVTLVPLMTERAYGTSLSDKSVYIVNNYVSGDCVLSANVYMLRRAAINKESSYWNKISLDTLRPYAAVNTNDIKATYSYTSYGLTYNVKRGSFGTISDDKKRDKLISLLNSHKEGIVVWGSSAGPGYPHGILITSYGDNTFYAADSTHNYDNYIYWYGTNEGIEPLAQTTVKKLTNLTHYWYLDKVDGVISGQPSNSTTQTGSSNTASKIYTLSCSENGGTGGKEINLDYLDTSSIKGSWVSRSGYTLTGWNLYREADNKWFTNNTYKWQTADTIKNKGYKKFLYDVNQTVQVGPSWIEGKSDAKNFTFYAVWTKNPATPTVSINLDTSSSTKSVNYKRIRATWKSISGASYQVRYRKNGGSWSSWIGVGTKTYYEKTMVEGAKYSVQVRAYKVDSESKKTCYSGVSAEKSVYTLKKTTLAVSRKSSTSVSVKWKNISGETGYQVYRKTGSSGNWGKVKTASNKYSSWTNTKRAKKKTYYYKIRTYKKVGSTVIYSPFSTTKKVKL